MLEPVLPDVPEVDPSAAHDMTGQGAVLIDIREDEEWDQARIPGAEHRPMSRIQEWWSDLPENCDIILQCRTGSRSAHAVDALIRQGGLERVYNLAGGLVAWHTLGLPITWDPPD